MTLVLLVLILGALVCLGVPLPRHRRHHPTRPNCGSWSGSGGSTTLGVDEIRTTDHERRAGHNAKPPPRGDGARRPRPTPRRCAFAAGALTGWPVEPPSSLAAISARLRHDDRLSRHVIVRPAVEAAVESDDLEAGARK